MFKNLSMEGLGISGQQSEVIELALSFRFQGVEWNMNEFAEQVDNYGLPHARRLLDSARIRVGQFPLPLTWDEWDEDDETFRMGLERLPRIAELAASLGCEHSTTAVQPASDERPYHENFEFHRRRLSEIADILQPHGIRLGLEFNAQAPLREGKAFQFIHTFDALTQLAKSVTNHHVGVVVDLWQLHVGGGSLDEIGQLPGERIVAALLSDVPADSNPDDLAETSRLMPCETGVIDCRAALTRLAEAGFAGPVTVRAARQSVDGKRRDQIVQLASQRLDQAWTEAGLDGSGCLPTATST